MGVPQQLDGSVHGKSKAKMITGSTLQFWKLILVGGLNPSEKYQSIGMIIPNIWENKIDVPNHQPVYHVHTQLIFIL